MTTSYLFALTAVVTAVDHLVVHLFVQWLMTSHLIQRPAAFYTFTSFLETKSPCQCEEAVDVRCTMGWVFFGLGQNGLGLGWVWVGFNPVKLLKIHYKDCHYAASWVGGFPGKPY